MSSAAVVIGTLRVNIYLVGVFTETFYRKPLECNVVYIPIIALSTGHNKTLNNFKRNYGSK